MASIQRFYIIAGTQLPSIKIAITRESTSAAYNLAGYTDPTFSMCRDKDSDSVVNGAVAVIEDAAGGIMRYDWAAVDTVTPGKYLGQFHAIDSEDRPAAFPNGSYLEIHVLRSLKT